MKNRAGRQLDNAGKNVFHLLGRLEAVYGLLVTRCRWFAVASAAVEDFRAKNIYYCTGNFTYNALLAMLAFMAAVSAAVGLLAASSTFSREATKALESLVPVIGSAPDQTLDVMRTYKGIVGVIGLVGLIWTSTKIFGAMEWGFCRIWGSDRRGYARRKLLGALFISGVGLMFLVVLFVQFGSSALWDWMVGPSGAVHGIGVRVAKPAFGFGVNFGLFLFIYKVVPTVKQGYRTIMVGAVVSAAACFGMQYLISWYFSSVSRMPAVYGSLSTVVVLIIWLHIGGFILFFGGELIFVARNRDLVEEHRERVKSRSFAPVSPPAEARGEERAEENVS